MLRLPLPLRAVPPLAAIALAAALLAACGGDGTPVVTPAPAPTGTPAASPTPEATPEPTPTSVAAPARCRDGDEALSERLERLAAEIETVMEGYDGDWGFGLVDVDCDAELAVRGEYVQYTASAGKIVPVIAALRAVAAETFAPSIPDEPVPMSCGALASPLAAAGEPIDFATMEQALLLVMTHSCDHEANLINHLVTAEQIAEVLEIAAVSEQTRFAHAWNQAMMPAIDLARVWAALIDGRLLDAERVEYLLALAARAQIPPAYETFPAAPEIPGWELGQKAGYCVFQCAPYALVGLGAGYLRPAGAAITDADGHRGLAAVLMVRTLNPDLADPQRRGVFPLLVDYALGDR